MPNSVHSQQLIFQRLWSNSSKRLYQEKLGPGMKIVGRVVGSVHLKDIGKVIAYDQVADLNETDINKSKDLQIALKNRWIEIIEDRGMMKRALAMATPQQKEEEKNDVMQMAREMAKEMAKEMVQNVLAKEIAGIKDSLKERSVVREYITSPETKEQKPIVIEEENPENVFIDVGETNVNANLNEIGIVKEEKTDLTDSLEKMKKFRRKVG